MTDDVARYELVCLWRGAWCETMQPHASGSYVLAADYDALAKRFEDYDALRAGKTHQFPFVDGAGRVTKLTFADLDAPPKEGNGD